MLASTSIEPNAFLVSRHDFACRLLPADVGHDRHDARTRNRVANARHRGAHGIGIAVDQHHTAAFLAEQKACGCPDPACATGNDRNFVFKSPNHAFLLA
jgi:hypothetical protein